MGVIYKATNTLNNKIYIGKTKRSLNKRMIDHITKANKGVVTHLYRAIRKYGKEAFKWEIVEETSDILLNDKEKYYILLNNSNDSRVGYNLTSGGDGCPDLIFTDEMRANRKKAADIMWSNSENKINASLRMLEISKTEKHKEQFRNAAEKSWEKRRGKSTSDKHKKAVTDQTIYTFINRSGEIFKGRKCDWYQKHNYNRKSASTSIKSLYGYKGWKIIDTDYEYK